MRTLGIDLASQPAKTAACVIDWSDEAATVSTPILGLTDPAILELAANCDIIGIDAPFGWPLPFVEFLTNPERADIRSSPWTAERRDSLRFRLTDSRVRDVLGRWPLSVSSDRIALAAMRCFGLLAALDVRDRSGDGRVFEVYPAGALHVWGFPSSGYKGLTAEIRANNAALIRILSTLLQACPWLRLSDEATRLCGRDDDAFDALIASIVARAARIGLTVRPTAVEAERARLEGWIAIPTPDALKRMFQSRQRPTSTDGTVVADV